MYYLKITYLYICIIGWDYMYMQGERAHATWHTCPHAPLLAGILLPARGDGTATADSRGVYTHTREREANTREHEVHESRSGGGVEESRRGGGVEEESRRGRGVEEGSRSRGGVEEGQRSRGGVEGSRRGPGVEEG